MKTIQKKKPDLVKSGLVRDKSGGADNLNPHLTPNCTVCQDLKTILVCELCGTVETCSLAYQTHQIDELGKLLCQTCIPSNWLAGAIVTFQPVVKSCDMASVYAHKVLRKDNFLFLRLGPIRGGKTGSTGIIAIFNSDTHTITTARKAGNAQWNTFRDNALADGCDDISKLYIVQVDKAAVITALETWRRGKK